MGAREYWDRMLVYFGIAEEAYDDELEERETPRHRAPSASARRATAGDEWDDDPSSASPAPRRASAGRRPPARTRASAPSQQVAGVGVVQPRSFNDAQQIADQFKNGAPVIVNLQATEPELARRVIDFASGLTYGLDGAMKPIADKVFLLTPADVDVSSEERAAMLESGFFNQS